MKYLIKVLLALTLILNCNQTKAEEINMKDLKKLVVYFSKTGEQYSVGNITEGNTAIIAKMISDETGADIFEVKLKNDTYPKAYKALTEVALSEKKANARPEIIDNIADFDTYDIVFIGTPNWWADMPMALYTFIEAHDWSNKTVIPFVTHEGSGLASIPAKIQSAANPKEMLSGFEIYGHTAQNNRQEAEKEVVSWLKKLGF